MPLDLDNLPPVREVKFGFYSKTAERRGGPVQLYRLVDGQEAEGTALCDDLEGRDYSFPDKVFIGLVTDTIRVIRVVRQMSMMEKMEFHSPYEYIKSDPYEDRYYDYHSRQRQDYYRRESYPRLSEETLQRLRDIRIDPPPN